MCFDGLQKSSALWGGLWMVLLWSLSFFGWSLDAIWMFSGWSLDGPFHSPSQQLSPPAFLRHSSTLPGQHGLAQPIQALASPSKPCPAHPIPCSAHPSSAQLGPAQLSPTQPAHPAQPSSVSQLSHSQPSHPLGIFLEEFIDVLISS